jgi:hypothetical protein
MFPDLPLAYLQECDTPIPHTHQDTEHDVFEEQYTQTLVRMGQATSRLKLLQQHVSRPFYISS